MLGKLLDIVISNNDVYANDSLHSFDFVLNNLKLTP